MFVCFLDLLLIGVCLGYHFVSFCIFCQHFFQILNKNIILYLHLCAIK